MTDHPHPSLRCIHEKVEMLLFGLAKHDVEISIIMYCAGAIRQHYKEPKIIRKIAYFASNSDQ